MGVNFQGVVYGANFQREVWGRLASMGKCDS